MLNDNLDKWFHLSQLKVYVLGLTREKQDFRIRNMVGEIAETEEKLLQMRQSLLKMRTVTDRDLEEMRIIIEIEIEKLEEELGWYNNDQGAV